MSGVINSSGLPASVETKLRRIRWRQASLATVRATVIAASMLMATMLVAMAIDWWFTIFSTVARSLLTVFSLTMTLAVFLWLSVRPVIQAWGWSRAASQADAEVPQLEERWRTVSHFAQSNNHPSGPVAAAMLQQVTSEAVAMSTLVEPARVARIAQLRRVALLMAATGVAVLGFLALDWEQNSVLLRRFWAPTAAITATHLESLSGDQTIPRGRTVELVTQLSGRQQKAATVTLISEAGERYAVELHAAQDAAEMFVYQLEVEQSYRYRVRAGDGQTAWHSITAIDPPELSDVQLTIAAPKYVNRPLYQKSLLPGRVKAIQGSRLTLQMRSDAELARFEMLLTGPAGDAQESSERRLLLEATADGWYRFETILEQDLTLSPQLFTPHGLTNEDRRVCRIRVIPDKAPVARVMHSADEMSVGRDDELDIKFEAHDDHGIAKAELVVYQELESGETDVLSVDEIPLGDQQLKRHILATAKLDLSRFDLDEGAQLSYAVRVTDNRLLDIDPTAERPRRTAEDANVRAANSDSPLETANVPQNSAAGETSATDRSQTGKLPVESLLNERAEETSAVQTAAVPQDREKGKSVADPAGGEQTTQGKPAPQAASGESAREALSQAEPADTDSSLDPQGNTEQQTSAGRNEQVSSQVPSADIQRTGANEATNEAAKSELTAQSDSNRQQPGATPATSAAHPDLKTEQPRSADEKRDPTTKLSQSQPAQQAPTTESSTATGEQVTPAATGGAQPRSDDADAGEADREPMPATDESDPNPADQAAQAKERSGRGSVRLTEAGRGAQPSSLPPLEIARQMSFETQRGQDTESNRIRLKITDRLAVAAEAGERRRSDAMQTREWLQRIDQELAAAESILLTLNEGPDLDTLPDQSKQADAKLEQAEQIIAEVRKASKDTKYEFVGLQLVDISRNQLTPARDRMFVLIQDPGANPNRQLLESLHHTASARELLAALTKRFEAVARERDLAESLEEIAKIYEVYVENMQGVLREARQNKNPLERKMAVIEVDEAYLKRYTEVLEMRRELMKEFARILSDDPRLMGKYMDLIKRRRNSLRNQLTDLRERQEDISTELSGWLRVDETQRPDVWLQVAEMRLLAAKPLVKDASQLEARTLSQLPLNLELRSGASAAVVQHAKQAALNARASSIKARELVNDALETDDLKAELLAIAEELAYEIKQFDAALAQLGFDHQGDEDVDDFINKRLAESRGVAEQAIAWAELALHVRQGNYHGLAAVDQQLLAVDTDRLRIAMLGIEDDLEGEFQPDDVPAEVTSIVQELQSVMEAITFNQAAATFELDYARLDKAEEQQTMAGEAFQRAEELFDKMRRTVVEILDEREVDDPNIADLEDPTLDEFLERLEREPNLNELLGIPNRPRNLRVIRDWLLWEEQGNGAPAGAAGEAAANALARAELAAQSAGDKPERRQPAPANTELTEEEMQRFAAAESTEEEMEKMLRAIEEKMKDPASDEEQRKELQKQAEMLANLLQQARNGSVNQQRWRELAESDELKAMLKALAAGEPVPDSQWNRVLSTLDVGLWQVRGRTPSEDYRRAIEQYQDQIRRLLSDGVIGDQ